MDSFTGAQPLTGIKDSVILKFFKKYNIRLMHIDNCNKYLYNDLASPLTTCGEKIELYFNGTPVVSNEHTIIFDYSEVPLI